MSSSNSNEFAGSGSSSTSQYSDHLLSSSIPYKGIGDIKSRPVLEVRSIKEEFETLLGVVIERDKPNAYLLTILQALIEKKAIPEKAYKAIDREKARIAYSFIQMGLSSDVDGAIISIKENRDSVTHFLEHILKKGFITSQEKEEIFGKPNEIPLDVKISATRVEFNTDKLIYYFLKTCVSLGLNFFQESELSKSAFHLLAALMRKYVNDDTCHLLYLVNPLKKFDAITQQSSEVMSLFLMLLDDLRKKSIEKTLMLLTAEDSEFSYLLAKCQSDEVIRDFLTFLDALLRQGLNRENSQEFIDILSSLGLPLMSRKGDMVQNQYLTLLESFSTLKEENKAKVLNLIKEPMGNFTNLCAVVAARDEAAIKIRFLKILQRLSEPGNLTPFILPYIAVRTLEDEAIKILSENRTMFNQLAKTQDGETLFFLIRQGFIGGSFRQKLGYMTIVIDEESDFQVYPETSDPLNPLINGYQWLHQYSTAEKLEQAISALSTYVLDQKSSIQRDKLLDEIYKEKTHLGEFLFVCEQVLGKKRDVLFHEVLQEKVRLNCVGLPKKHVFDWKKGKFFEIKSDEKLRNSDSLSPSSAPADSQGISADLTQDQENIRVLFLALLRVAHAELKDFYKVFFRRFMYQDAHYKKIMFSFTRLGFIPEESYHYMGENLVNSLLKKATESDEKTQALTTFTGWAEGVHQDIRRSTMSGERVVSLTAKMLPSTSEKEVIDINSVMELFRSLEFNWFSSGKIAEVCFNLIDCFSKNKAIRRKKIIDLMQIMISCYDFSCITTQSSKINHRFLSLLARLSEEVPSETLNFIHRHALYFGSALCEMARGELTVLFLMLMNKFRIKNIGNQTNLVKIVHCLEDCGFSIMEKHEAHIRHQYIDLVISLMNEEKIIRRLYTNKKEKSPKDSKLPNQIELMLAIHQLLIKPYGQYQNFCWSVAHQGNKEVKEKLWEALGYINQFPCLRMTPYLLPNFRLKYRNISDSECTRSFYRKSVFKELVDKRDGASLLMLIEKGLIAGNFFINQDGFFVSQMYKTSSADTVILKELPHSPDMGVGSRVVINGYDWLLQYDRRMIAKGKELLCKYLLDLGTSQKKYQLLKQALNPICHLGKFFILRKHRLGGDPTIEKGTYKKINDECKGLEAIFNKQTNSSIDTSLTSSSSSSAFFSSSSGAAPPLQTPREETSTHRLEAKKLR